MRAYWPIPCSSSYFFFLLQNESTKESAKLGHANKSESEPAKNSKLSNGEAEVGKYSKLPCQVTIKTEPIDDGFILPPAKPGD